MEGHRELIDRALFIGAYVPLMERVADLSDPPASQDWSEFVAEGQILAQLFLDLAHVVDLTTRSMAPKVRPLNRRADKWEKEALRLARWEMDNDEDWYADWWDHYATRLNATGRFS
jgi:hypothetical protein